MLGCMWDISSPTRDWTPALEGEVLTTQPLWKSPGLGVFNGIFWHPGFPCGSAGKESPCNAGDLGLTSGLTRSPGEGRGYPLQYSSLENSLYSKVHGVAKSWAWLNDFHFHFDIHFEYRLAAVAGGIPSVKTIAANGIVSATEKKQKSIL